ncbi:hypothetical protein XAUB_21010 [Xanthomonas citri pv. aurantifolii str. ICPB 11122]|nr:hypothetical protein XAUB_21010 [Xanthomonas citri pv. aurantifolii str. ICPB 11122]
MRSARGVGRSGSWRHSTAATSFQRRRIRGDGLVAIVPAAQPAQLQLALSTQLRLGKQPQRLEQIGILQEARLAGNVGAEKMRLTRCVDVAARNQTTLAVHEAIDVVLVGVLECAGRIRGAAIDRCAACAIRPSISVDLQVIRWAAFTAASEPDTPSPAVDGTQEPEFTNGPC